MRTAKRSEAQWWPLTFFLLSDRFSNMPGLSDFNCEIVRTRGESKHPEDEVDHNLPYMVRISFFIVCSFFWFWFYFSTFSYIRLSATNTKSTIFLISSPSLTSVLNGNRLAQGGEGFRIGWFDLNKSTDCEFLRKIERIRKYTVDLWKDIV